MKVTLTKHGGLAAGIRRPPGVVDSGRLPRASAVEMARLVEAARAAPSAEAGGSGLARDAMSYTITVEDDGRTVVLQQSDTDLSPPFADLLNWLERHVEGK